jgi:hypothetical protein
MLPYYASSPINWGREAVVATKTMTPEQHALFQRYVAMGEDRTLARLQEELARDPVTAHVTIRMLERYSSKFHWRDLVKHVQNEIVAVAVEQAAPIIQHMIQEQIEALHTIQRRFIDRVAIDPNAPDLTDVQRARAIDPDFKEFAEAIKLERLLMGDPTERKEVVTTESRLVAELTKEELIAIARETAAKRFGAAPRHVETIEGHAREVKALPDG